MEDRTASVHGDERRERSRSRDRRSPARRSPSPRREVDVQIGPIGPPSPTSDAATEAALSQFVAQNTLDAAAEKLLRSQPREVQRKIIDDGVCMGSNPSAVLISRVRRLLGQPGIGAPSGAVPGIEPAESLEAFIRENELDESAVKALMQVSSEVQQRVMAEGIVTGRNKSAILVGRIRRCLSQPGVSGALPTGYMAPPKGNTDPSAGFGREQLEHFVQVNCLDPHAEKVLREQPSDIQARVCGEGPVTGDNKSRIVMGRIRRSQGTGRYALGALGGQPSPYMPGAVGSPAPGIDEFIRANQLDSLAERELLALPVERQILVMGEGEVTGSNKSAVVMGRIRRVNQGELPGSLNSVRLDAFMGGSSPPPPPMSSPPMETFAAAAQLKMQRFQPDPYTLFQQQMPMHMLQQQLQQQQMYQMQQQTAPAPQMQQVLQQPPLSQQFWPMSSLQQTPMQQAPMQQPPLPPLPMQQPLLQPPLQSPPLLQQQQPPLQQLSLQQPPMQHPPMQQPPMQQQPLLQPPMMPLQPQTMPQQMPPQLYPQQQGLQMPPEPQMPAEHLPPPLLQQPLQPPQPGLPQPQPDSSFWQQQWQQHLQQQTLPTQLPLQEEL